jgi:3-methyl-2-oxobutanoate hydroxymethyltransferase
LRKYNNLHDQMMTSFQDYIKDVKSGDFPNESEQY